MAMVLAVALAACGNATGGSSGGAGAATPVDAASTGDATAFDGTPSDTATSTGADTLNVDLTDTLSAADELAADGSGPLADGDSAADAAQAVDSAGQVDGGVKPDTAPPADAAPSCDPAQLSDLFQKKIKPLVSKGQPTTCNQCHLSGIDLGLFVQDTPCNAMACMKSKGLVDFTNPPQSQVLAMIAKAKPESKLITTAVQQAEYDAFLQWIVWSASCQNAACGVPAADPCFSGPLPPPPTKPMLGGCDEATLAGSFATKVFKWKHRCDHCHSPTGKDANKSFGGAKPTLFLHPTPGSVGAKFTMYNVLSLQGGVNVVNPTQSTLLVKPLAEDAGGVWHGGGDKFQDTSDPSYVDFLAWIKQVAVCKTKM